MVGAGIGADPTVRYCGWAVTHIGDAVKISRQAQEASRERLLAAAADAFARRGIDGANINEISLAAGLGKGTVYNYFASKVVLFAAVVEEACRLAAGGARSVGSGAPTRDRLRAAVASDMAWAHDHEAFARVLVREVFAGKPEVYARIVQAGAPYIDHVAGVLRDGIARGEVRADADVEELALIFAGLGLLMLAHHWGSGGAWPTFEEIPDLVVRTFYDSLDSGQNGAARG